MEAISSTLSNVLSKGLNFIITITMMYFFLFFMLININRMEAAIVRCQFQTVVCGDIGRESVQSDMAWFSLSAPAQASSRRSRY